MNTKIEWTDTSWNPQTGCLPGLPCWERCYARRMARRLAGRCGYPEAPDSFRPTFHPARLAGPLSWRKPRSCFISSMGDIALAEPEQIAAILGVVAACPDSQFQVLTKRPGLLLEWFEWAAEQATRDFVTEAEVIGVEAYAGTRNLITINPRANRCKTWPLPNLAIGVSVSTQADADERIPLLLRIPAACRFVSQEPALGVVNFGLVGTVPKYISPRYQPVGDMIDGIILGGETGPGARPMHPDWARSTRDQCEAAGVAFFFKSWGEWAENGYRDDCDPGERLQWGSLLRDGSFTKWPGDSMGRSTADIPDGESVMVRVGKKRAGRSLDGRIHDALPWRQS